MTTHIHPHQILKTHFPGETEVGTQLVGSKSILTFMYIHFVYKTVCTAPFVYKIQGEMNKIGLYYYYSSSSSIIYTNPAAFETTHGQRTAPELQYFVEKAKQARHIYSTANPKTASCLSASLTAPPTSSVAVHTGVSSAVQVVHGGTSVTMSDIQVL